jgi:hypothetical protein
MMDPVDWVLGVVGAADSFSLVPTDKLGVDESHLISRLGCNVLTDVGLNETHECVRVGRYGWLVASWFA